MPQHTTPQDRPDHTTRQRTQNRHPRTKSKTKKHTEKHAHTHTYMSNARVPRTTTPPRHISQKASSSNDSNETDNEQQTANSRQAAAPRHCVVCSSTATAQQHHWSLSNSSSFVVSCSSFVVRPLFVVRSLDNVLSTRWQTTTNPYVWPTYDSAATAAYNPSTVDIMLRGNTPLRQCRYSLARSIS